MVPLIHNFIKDLSNTQVSKLFLAGAHASIYVAHYEVIVHEGMSFLQALVMVVIIVVIVYYAYPMLKTGFGKMMAVFADMAATSTLTGALSIMMGAFIESIPNMLLKMAAQYIIQVIITEVAGDNPELAAILNLVSMVAISAWEPGVSFGSAPGTAPLGSYGTTGGATIGAGGGSLIAPGTINPQGLHYSGMTFSAANFSDLGLMDFAGMAMDIVNAVAKGMFIRAEAGYEDLAEDYADFGKYKELTAAELAGKNALLDEVSFAKNDLLVGALRYDPTMPKYIGASAWIELNNLYCELDKVSYEQTGYFEQTCSVEQRVGYA
jgi:hypothetical protein